MKYIIIPFIALGLVLSLAIGVEYNCHGTEMFPTYFGSPFVFMRTSLVSSMECYYGVFALMVNVLIWSLTIYSLRYLILKCLEKLKMRCKKIVLVYQFCVLLLLCFSSMVLASHVVILGSGFSKYNNYWYLEMDSEAEKWGVDCIGSPVIFKI